MEVTPLVFGQQWPVPYYDEPEDAPQGFEQFLRDNAPDARAIGYWDIAKAKKLGVWTEDATFLYFNWYPACSAIPALFRWAYVPFKALQYRLWYSRRNVPVRLTLWSGRYPDGLKDEYGYTYGHSERLNRWSWFWFKLLMWPRCAGQVWF